MNEQQFEAFLATMNNRQGQQGQRRAKELESTDPLDWLDWRDNFETAADIARWDDKRQRREISGAMVGKAKQAVRDIAKGDRDPVGPARDLLDQYEARFMPEAASDLARAQFQSAAQYDDETLLHWHGRLRDLFRRAYPMVADAAVNTSQDLRDAFIRNLRDRPVAEVTHRARAATYQAVLACAMNAEATTMFFAATDRAGSRGSSTSKAMFTMGRGATRGNRGGSSGNFGSRGRGGTSRSNGRDYRTGCHNCGRSNHGWRTCRDEIRDAKAHADGYRSLRGGSRRGRGSYTRGGGTRNVLRTVNSMGEDGPFDDGNYEDTMRGAEN